MGILLPATMYDTLSGAVPWVPAPHPSDVIDYRNTTAVAKREVVRELHNILVMDFHIEANADKLLVKILIVTVGEDNFPSFILPISLLQYLLSISMKLLVRKLKRCAPPTIPRCKKWLI